MVTIEMANNLSNLPNSHIPNKLRSDCMKNSWLECGRQRVTTFCGESKFFKEAKNGSTRDQSIKYKQTW